MGAGDTSTVLCRELLLADAADTVLPRTDAVDEVDDSGGDVLPFSAP